MLVAKKMSYDSRDVSVDQTRLRAQIDKLNNDELKRFLNDDNITTREDLYRIIESEFQSCKYIFSLIVKPLHAHITMSCIFISSSSFSCGIDTGNRDPGIEDPYERFPNNWYQSPDCP